MTNPQPPPPAVAEVRAIYDQAETAVTTLAGDDSLTAFHTARALLEELEALAQRARVLRDQMVLRVRDDRKLSLAGLSEVLRWPVTRPRMQQIIDRARGSAEPTQPPAA